MKKKLKYGGDEEPTDITDVMGDDYETEGIEDGE